MNRRDSDGELRGIYPQLSGTFDLTEEQKQCVQARIMQRIASEPEPETAEPVPPVPKKSGLLWLRFVPLAACLMLAVGGGFLFLRSVQKTEPVQEPTSRTENDIAEVTVSSTAAETTQPVTDTAALPQTVTTLSTAQTVTAAEAPAPEQTTTALPAAQTDAADSPRTAEASASGTGSTATSTATSTTASETTTTAAETTTEMTDVMTTAPEGVPGAIRIVMPGCTAKPGETVTLRMVNADAFTSSGIQFNLDVSVSNGAAPPVCEARTELDAYTASPIGCNADGGSLSLVYVGLAKPTIPAGTLLLEIRFTVPADMPPGTVISFRTVNALIVKDTGLGDLPCYPVEFSPGTVTVTG